MSKTLTTAERVALAPLLQLARLHTGGAQRLWLEELRREAPTVAARLAALLDGEADATPTSSATSAEVPSPSVGGDSRVSAPRGGARPQSVVGLPTISAA
jgi:hypothetical protein